MSQGGAQDQGAPVSRSGSDVLVPAFSQTGHSSSTIAYVPQGSQPISSPSPTLTVVSLQESQHSVPSVVSSEGSEPIDENIPGSPPPRLIAATPPAGATGVDHPQTPDQVRIPSSEQREWKSWKIKVPLLSLLLAVEVSFIATILTLDFISKRNSGFVELGDAPSFLAHDKNVEKAIWAQGILYTALPAFIMTIFHTCWHSAVSAAAKRKPFVELKKPDGAPATTTIMLEYVEPFALSWFYAVKNGHNLLAGCMLSSAIVAYLVVPLTAFLFTNSQFQLNSTFPLSIKTAFNTSILGDYPNFPNLRFMDTAAAIHIQGGSPPPWTDWKYAFPTAVPLNRFKEGNATLESSAYSAMADCVYLKEGTYQRKISMPEDTGIPAISIFFSANDRGCHIFTTLNIRHSREAKKTYIKSWATTTCPAYAGWSRFSFLTTQITGNKQLSNFSLVSCAPTYHTSLGTLTAMWISDAAAPIIRSFIVSNISESRADEVWRLFEMGVQSVGCYDPEAGIDTNEFGRQIHRLASSRAPASPLLPTAIIDAAQTMFTSMFAVFASYYLLQPTDTPIQRSGTMLHQSTKLILVSPIAYAITAILFAVAILNVALIFEGRRASILGEESIGLLGAAAILHKSDITEALDELSSRPGQIVQDALKNEKFRNHVWKYKDGILIRGVQIRMSN